MNYIQFVRLILPRFRFNLPPEKSDSAAINILCPGAAFRHSAFSPTTPEGRPYATNRISAVGQVDVPLARHGHKGVAPGAGFPHREADVADGRGGG